LFLPFLPMPEAPRIDIAASRAISALRPASAAHMVHGVQGMRALFCASMTPVLMPVAAGTSPVGGERSAPAGDIVSVRDWAGRAFEQKYFDTRRARGSIGT
jgi:hypothetical protein